MLYNPWKKNSSLKPQSPMTFMPIVTVNFWAQLYVSWQISYILQQWMKNIFKIHYFILFFHRSKRYPRNWNSKAKSGVRRKEEEKVLMEQHWKLNISPKIYRSSPPNIKHLLMARLAHTVGLRTSHKPWISICIVLLPNPNLQLKLPQRPKRSWAGGIFTLMWKQWNLASWWQGRLWITSMEHSASTSATIHPVWGTYLSALFHLPKLWDGRFLILHLRVFTLKTQYCSQIWCPSFQALLSPPAPLLPNSRSSSRTWWWWLNSTAGSSTREPTGPRRPSPACTTQARHATQKTPSPRQPGSVPNHLRLYASSSPSLAQITDWCRKFALSRTSSTLGDKFWDMIHWLLTRPSNILQNHMFSFPNTFNIKIHHQPVSECRLSQNLCCLF